MNCTTRVAKTKALISFAVTAKLICTFVFRIGKNPVFSQLKCMWLVYVSFRDIFNEQFHYIMTTFIHSVFFAYILKSLIYIYFYVKQNYI